MCVVAHGLFGDHGHLGGDIVSGLGILYGQPVGTFQQIRSESSGGGIEAHRRKLGILAQKFYLPLIVHISATEIYSREICRLSSLSAITGSHNPFIGHPYQFIVVHSHVPAGIKRNGFLSH